jgi:hypothetical protein
MKTAYFAAIGIMMIVAIFQPELRKKVFPFATLLVIVGAFIVNE